MSLDLSSGPLQQDPRYVPQHHRIGMITKWSFVLLVLVATWLILGTSTVQSIKGWLGRREARTAVAAMQVEDWGQAINCILEARRYAPADPVVIRAMVEFLQMTGSDPVTLAQLMRQLDEQEKLKVDDHILWADALLAVGDTTGARKIYEKVPEASREEPKTLKLAAKIVSAEGRPDEAKEITRRMILKDANTPDSKLAIALEKRQSSFQEIRQGARDDLWQIARLNDNAALEAITHLSIDPKLTVAETEEMLELVENHPNRSLPVRLGVITAQMHLQQGKREAILDAEVARFQAKGGGRLEDIARWLALEKQHDRILKLVPQSLATRSHELYPIIAQALAEADRWADLKQMLTSAKAPVSDVRVHIWLAEAESHLQPNLDESRRLLSTCVESSRLEKNVPNLLASIALAEKLRFSEIALAGCFHVAKLMPEAAVEALQRARDLALMLKDTRAVLDISRQLHELRPSSPAFADQLTYFRLLLGEEMEQVDLTALKKNGALDDATASAYKVQRIPVSLLEALAAFRFSDREAVLKHVLRLPVTDGLPAGHRAVLAGLLATTGKPDRAFQIAEKIPASLLLDEEKSFLKLAQ